MPAASPVIVAELSANHLGSVERALALVEAAARSGADAVKLQTWNEMTFEDSVITCGPWGGRTLHDLYAEARTPWEWHEQLFARAALCGIDCFSSVFDPESCDFLESLGCPRFKIASFEITDLPLIRYVAGKGKPTIISTGMATQKEIAEAYAEADAGGCPDITLLKCTSAYPAPESNLLTLFDLMRNYPKVGFSDHSLGIGAAVAAATLGATMIEKHLTLSRADGGPDAGFSAEPDEFAAMVRACKEAAAALGSVRYGPTQAEQDSLQFRRGLYFTRDLDAGEIIGASDVRSARPANGIAPKALPDILWRTLRVSVRRGQPVMWEMIA